MKKTLIALYAALLLVAAAAPVRAEKQGYSFGVYWDAGSKLNTNFSIIAKDITKAFSKTEKVQLSNLYYNNLDSFLDDIGTRKLDFIYANTEDDFLLATIYGYKPFAAISLFGKDKAGYCLYVKKDGPIADVNGLAGKKIVTYPQLTAYAMLRKLINAAPEKTFGGLSTTTDAFASADALVSGAADAVFLLETNVDYFDQVNPGTSGAMRKLACAEPLNFMPLMASPEVSADMLKRTETFYSNLHNNEVLVKYRPLIKQIGFKIIPVSEADYKSFFDLYESSMSQGWDKDFETWMATAKQLK